MIFRSERANLAISLAGAGEGEAAHSVLGHISLFDYPNAAAGVEPAGWGEWLHTHYHCPKASVSGGSLAVTAL